MRTLCGVMLVVALASVLVLLGAAWGAEEFPLGKPKANLAVDQLVPFDLVEKIAAKKAQEKWGEVAMGAALPCCDDDGDIVAYMFPCAIGQKAFPAHAEILASVKAGRALAQGGLNSLPEPEQQQIIESARMEAQRRIAARGGPDVELQGNALCAAADQKARRLGQTRSIGGDRFGTVVVSARYDRFPVPLYMHYLPPYFYQADLALQQALAVLGNQQVTLERVYFLEANRSQLLEWSCGGRTLLQHAFTLEPQAPEKALAQRGRKLKPVPETAAEIAAQWAKAKQEVDWRDPRPAEGKEGN